MTTPQTERELPALPEPAGYTAPGDPFSSTAFSWPGTARVKSRHTSPVFTSVQMRDYARAAIELTRPAAPDAVRGLVERLLQRFQSLVDSTHGGLEGSWIRWQHDTYKGIVEDIIFHNALAAPAANTFMGIPVVENPSMAPDAIALVNAAPAVDGGEFKGWYCAHCQRGVDGGEVTYHEQHQECGRVITDDRPPAPTPPADAERARELLAAEYERSGMPGAADDARAQNPSPHCACTLRAITQALRERPAQVEAVDHKKASNEMAEIHARLLTEADNLLAYAINRTTPPPAVDVVALHELVRKWRERSERSSYKPGNAGPLVGQQCANELDAILAQQPGAQS